MQRRAPAAAAHCMMCGVVAADHLSLSSCALQAGQFIGARADFVPSEICTQLCVLNDRVRAEYMGWAGGMAPSCPASHAHASLPASCHPSTAHCAGCTI